MDASDKPLSQFRNTYPEILDLLNPCESFLFLLLQYLSTLIACPSECPRLRLVYVLRGCHNFESWYTRFPQDIRVLNLAVMCLTSAIEKRELQYLQDHFGCLQIADKRLPRSIREGVASDLVAKKRCCVPYGISRGLYDKAQGHDGPTQGSPEKPREPKGPGDPRVQGSPGG